MSKRHSYLHTATADLLIDCPLDANYGLLDLVSGQSIIGKSTGDIVWDSTQQAYQFKTQYTAQGSKGIYLENLILPQPFDWSVFQYGASFDIKRLNNTGGAFACNALWWTSPRNRSEAPVYIYYNSGSNEIKLTDANWHHVDVIWTQTAKDEYLDGNFYYSEPYTTAIWEGRQYLDYNKYLICGAPFSGVNGHAFMKNLKVWRERL